MVHLRDRFEDIIFKIVVFMDLCRWKWKNCRYKNYIYVVLHGFILKFIKNIEMVCLFFNYCDVLVLMVDLSDKLEDLIIKIVIFNDLCRWKWKNCRYKNYIYVVLHGFIFKLIRNSRNGLFICRVSWCYGTDGWLEW
jgi:hypothetical protein